MSSYIVPYVGSSGTFTLASPFDKVIIADEIYTCRSIRKLSEYIANNETPLTDVYQNNGLTEDDYVKDLSEDMSIVGLQSGPGNWIYVPVKYILSYPNTSGVAYIQRAISVTLPPMDERTDTVALANEIASLIRGTLGVECYVESVDISRRIILTQAEHMAEVAKQHQLSALKGSVWAQLKIANDTIGKLGAQLQQLIAFAKTKI